MASGLKAYGKETQKPVYSAALVLPFLCLYHAGTLLLHTTVINGADALINRILGSLSVHSVFGSALVLLACFVLWQLRTRANWKVRSGTLLLSFAESCGYALLLLAAFGWLGPRLSLASGHGPHGLSRLVLYCGAGVYEELLFRGFLLSLLLAAYGLVFPKEKAARVLAATLTGALVFSAFHYVGPTGDVFSWDSFLQRALAGLYFSALFVTRGFGITAAAHAIYDIFVGLIF